MVTPPKHAVHWLAAAVLWMGCGQKLESADTVDTVTPPPDCHGIQLALGTGETTYAPLEPGGPVYVVKGVQGLWHIETAALITGTNAEVSAASVIKDVYGTPLSDPVLTWVHLQSYSSEQCQGEIVGLRALVATFPQTSPAKDRQAFICGLEGTSAEICMEVLDMSNGESTTSCIPGTLMMDASNGCGEG